MFDHVTIRVADRATSEGFYRDVLAAAGIAAPAGDAAYVEWRDLSLATADAEHPPTTGLHVGFAVPTRAHVDAFWHAGRARGAADDGAPGPRPEYTPSYYGAFLRDPDGNSVEAVHRDRQRRDGLIDHLWVRVADLPATRDFYAVVAPFAGLRLAEDGAGRVELARVGPGGGWLSLLPGEPTANLHVAFPAADHATVDAFHAAALAAGHASNGAPGERPEYHPGYYGAFVIAPDGANVEVVDHGRGAAAA